MYPTQWNNTAPARGFRAARRATKVNRLKAENANLKQLLYIGNTYLTAFVEALKIYANEENWLLKDEDIIWNGKEEDPSIVAQTTLKYWRERYDNGNPQRATGIVREDPSTPNNGKDGPEAEETAAQVLEASPSENSVTTGTAHGE
jgi:hypothetical protein